MSSAVTAKTLENKSLIMGRIFKKAVRDEPPTKKKGSETGKKKDFNKLFDNLRNIDFKQTKKMIKKVTKKKAAAVKSTKKTAIPVQKPLEDGQRKSQRRCAANRSKKLVEMWSSDEYEEFLSTNDVIALIEEKEREEKKKQAPAAKITARRNTVVIEKAPEPKPKAKPGKSTLITPLYF
uniref:Active regulator of SIRT1 n=1 Tax=Megaselia scalaris TaxID=36166 RepID=T1GCM5_MEGSC